MIYLLGLATFVATLCGGLFAIRQKDTLHLILGFSAGAVIGVAFFDLLPESLSLVGPNHRPATVMFVVAVGFLLYMFLSRVFLAHPHSEEDAHSPSEKLGAASLSLHSLLDGLGIGLAWQASPAIGLVVAAAVLAHDFSDGINTVSFVLKDSGDTGRARRWLLLDAVAPIVGIGLAQFITLTDSQLGLVLALFGGFFLYIGASDLVPESHHRHPQLITSLMTILGAAVIYGAVRLAG